MALNFGQDGDFAGTVTAQGNADGNGYGDFYYAPPSGYLALCTQNLATELSPTIDDGSQYFNTLLWTGNGADNRSITGVGFQPDTVWYKERNSGVSHRWVDAVRGSTKLLFPNNNDDEFTDANELQAFESDGFQVGNDGSINGSSDTYVGWCWKGSNTTASNSDGSTTSTISANQTSGFSIVSYTGTGSVATIGHGLGKVPAMMIVKRRSGADDWAVYHKARGEELMFRLNTTSAEHGDLHFWNDTAPTSSVFTVGTNSEVNASGQTYIAYIFAEIEGYSKFGSYTGNNSTDGVFVYTGFRPAFIITKKTDGASNWGMLDATRSSFNLADDWLGANLSNAESVETTRSADLLSNGFKARGANGDINHDSPYIYMAFGHTFVDSNGNPNTAR
jgi:hypothetical protein